MEGILRFSRGYRWELTVALTVILIAALSFALGYTMAKDASRTPIIIEKNSE